MTPSLFTRMHVPKRSRKKAWEWLSITAPPFCSSQQLWAESDVGKSGMGRFLIGAVHSRTKSWTDNMAQVNRDNCNRVEAQICLQCRIRRIFQTLEPPLDLAGRSWVMWKCGDCEYWTTDSRAYSIHLNRDRHTALPFVERGASESPQQKRSRSPSLDVGSQHRQQLRAFDTVAGELVIRSGEAYTLKDREGLADPWFLFLISS